MIRATVLFEDRQGADRLRQALENAGFRCAEIDREATELTVDGEVGADDLVRLGFAGEEAGRFANSIRRGATLLVVSTRESRGEELLEVTEQFDLVEMSVSEPPEQLRFRPRSEAEKASARREGDVIDESGVHRDERMHREFRRADGEYQIGEHDTGDATGLSRRAYGPGTPEVGRMLRAAGVFPEDLAPYEAACRRHHQNYMGDIPLTFGEVAWAYRYGLRLGRDADSGETWDDVETVARGGWNPQIDGPWVVMRRAVKFGWQLIRGGTGRRADAP